MTGSVNNINNEYHSTWDQPTYTLNKEDLIEMPFSHRRVYYSGSYDDSPIYMDPESRGLYRQLRGGDWINLEPEYKIEELPPEVISDCEKIYRYSNANTQDVVIAFYKNRQWENISQDMYDEYVQIHTVYIQKRELLNDITRQIHLVKQNFSLLSNTCGPDDVTNAWESLKNLEAMNTKAEIPNSGAKSRRDRLLDIACRIPGTSSVLEELLNDPAYVISPDVRIIVENQLYALRGNRVNKLTQINF